MKNRIKQYSLLSFLLAETFFLTACEGFMDDFLDTTESTETEITYFENQNRIDRGIGSIYAEIGVMYGTNGGEGGSVYGGGPLCFVWLLPGDDLTIDRPSLLEMEGFINLQNDNGTIRNIWNIIYTTINRANFMLDVLDNPSYYPASIPQEYITHCKGEALFLRAYCNTRLWYNFHKAPNQNFRIREITKENMPPAKDFELLDQAVEDLKLAEEYLPEIWDRKNKGRVFKNSARGLLVKAYVLRACYANKYNGNAQEDYLKAIEAYNRITPLSTIEGVHYGDNFDYTAENNPESLYEYQATFNSNEDNPWLNGNQGSASAQLGVMWFQFATDSRCQYLISNASFGPTAKFRNAFDPGDPRIEETYRTREWNRFENFQFIKYIKRDGAPDDVYGVMSRNNPRILRLADVKLLVAEAYLNTGQEALARRQVNDIRRRARNSTSSGVPTAVPADCVSPITMQDIMDERLRELGGEDDIRFTDIKRWHVAGYINLSEWAGNPVEMWGYPFNDQGAPFAFNAERDLLLPIPTSEMNANPQMMISGNNPGY
jgi:hypothetical protein